MTSNKLSNIDTNIDVGIKNKGFSIIGELFRDNGWNLTTNFMTHMVFSKEGNELDRFEIKISATSIQVTVPLKNSRYQYVTYFKGYYEASEYVESRLLEFIETS